MNSTVLAKLRREAQRVYLTDSCVIERPYPTTSDLMTPTESWSVIGSGVKCRVVKLAIQRESNKEVGELQAMEDMYRIALPDGTEIAADDRIWVNGIAYDVMSLEDQLTDKFFIHVVVNRFRGVAPL